MVWVGFTIDFKVFNFSFTSYAFHPCTSKDKHLSYKHVEFVFLYPCIEYPKWLRVPIDHLVLQDQGTKVQDISI